MSLSRDTPIGAALMDSANARRSLVAARSSSAENDSRSRQFGYTRPMSSDDVIDRVREFTRPAPGLRRWVDAIEATRHEVSALVRQTPLMPRDVLSKPLRLHPDTTDIVVVLHGLFATAGAMRPLRDAIERRAAVPTFSFTYAPGCSVRSLAARLAALLSDAPSTTRIQLVGHSLGGLVARHYVQVSPRDDRVVQTVSLGSPFAGTHIARAVPRFLACDLLRDARALHDIEASWRDGERVPHTSIVASHDHLVVPSWSAAYPHGDVFVASSRGHNSLLFDPHIANIVSDIVVSRIRSYAARDLQTPAPINPARIELTSQIATSVDSNQSLPLAAG